MNQQQRKSVKQLIYIQILTFASFAPMTYYNVFLRQIGFESTQLGFWGAVLGLAGIVTLPVWGAISDKSHSPKIMFMVSIGVYALVFTFIPLAGQSMHISPIPLYILIVLYGVVKDPSHSLQDAWMISTIAPIRGMNYASIRMWGSLGYGVISILFSIFADRMGIDKIFYAAPLFVLPAIIILLGTQEPRSAVAVSSAERAKINPFSLLKNYYYSTALIMTLVLGMYIGMTQSFFAYILENAGVELGAIGLISGYGSLLQVALMWFAGKHLRHIPAPRLLIIGGVFGVLENVMYAFSSGLGMMMIASTFWAVAVSARVSVLPSYLFALVPREYSASAQTINSTVVMLLTIVGNLAGGFLVASLGISSYNLLIAGVQVVLTGLFALSIPFGQKVLKIKPPAGITGGN